MKLKPYPEYKDSGFPWLGEIPAHWDVIRNGHLFQEIVDTNHPDLDLLSIMMDRGIILQSESGRKTRASEDRSTYKRIQPGQLGYNLMNAFMGSIGISKYEGILSPAYAVAKPRLEVEPWYFHHLFRTPIYLEVFDSYSYGIMYERNRLYYERFKLIYSSLPPLEEQKAIVKYIRFISQKINHFIRNKRSLIKLLNEQKQVIINQAVTRGLNPNVALKSADIPDLVEIPEDWKIRRLKTLLRGIDQGISPLSEAGLAENGRWGVLKSGCSNRGVFKESEHKQLPEGFPIDEKIIVRIGDVIVSRACGTPELVGSTARVRNLNYNLVLSDKNFRLNFKSHIPIDYVVMVMNSSYFRRIVRNAISGAEGLANNLPLSELKIMPIVIPSKLEEAIEIVSFLDTNIEKINSKITLIQREISLMQEYRTRLITDIVTGKIDVRDIEIPAWTDEDIVEELKDEELLEEAEAELEEDGNTDE
jgi:type I restriction enzyme S subunit